MLHPVVFLAISVLGVVPIAYLLLNAVLSRGQRPARGPPIAASEVTILIPVYRQRPEVFQACLAAAASQGSRLVVVGDASLEPYRTLVAARGGEFLHLAEHRGKKGALAAGIARVSTPYVLLLDSDAVLPPNAVAELAAHLVPGVGGVGANVTVRDNGRLAAAGGEFIERAREVVLRAMSSRGSVLYLDGACVLVRTEAVRPFLASEEFQELRVLGRPSRLGDDWMLTDFLLRQGLRTVKAYSVEAVVEPPADLRSFVRQNVRWARSNWVRLGSYLRRGLPRSTGRLYAFEVVGTYLLPLVALVTLFGRIPLLLHSIALGSDLVRAVLFALVGPPVHGGSWPAPGRLALTIAGSFATGLFTGVAFGSRSTRRSRLLSGGALAVGVMFATSIYGLVSVWRASRWSGDDGPAGGLPCFRPTLGREPATESSASPHRLAGR